MQASMWLGLLSAGFLSCLFENTLRAWRIWNEEWWRIGDGHPSCALWRPGAVRNEARRLNVDEWEVRFENWEWTSLLRTPTPRDCPWCVRSTPKLPPRTPMSGLVPPSCAQRRPWPAQAGTGTCVHVPIRLIPIASLAWLGKQPPCPLLVWCEVKVTLWDRVGHTHTWPSWRNAVVFLVMSMSTSVCLTAPKALWLADSQAWRNDGIKFPRSVSYEYISGRPEASKKELVHVRTGKQKRKARRRGKKTRG